jgi:hypothetical protein
MFVGLCRLMWHFELLYIRDVAPILVFCTYSMYVPIQLALTKEERGKEFQNVRPGSLARHSLLNLQSPLTWRTQHLKRSDLFTRHGLLALLGN